MSSSIAELLVRVGADTKGAQSGLHAIQADMRQLESISTRASGPVGNFFGGLARNAFQMGIVAFGVNAVAESIARLTESLIGTNAQFEQYQLQLSVLMHSSAAAKDELQQLFVFAAKTPFELPEVVHTEYL